MGRQTKVSKINVNSGVLKLLCAELYNEISFQGKITIHYGKIFNTPLYKKEAGSALELTSLGEIMGLKKKKVL